MDGGQTRISSLSESIVNVVIGFTINYFANLVILPLFGFHISLIANFWMGMIYTAISVARSYAIRRYFNAQLIGAQTWVAESITWIKRKINGRTL